MQRLLFIIILIIAFQCHPVDKARNAPPNVLFILVDDLGYNDLGFMGSKYYETPNIDQLAQEGTYFTHAYAGSRVCSPSRATIMTGQFTARTGITDWIGALEGENWRKKNRHDKLLPAQYHHQLDHGITVLPEAYQKAGYRTFFAGKWHLGNEGSYPEDHGFDFNKGGYESGSPRGGYFSPYENPKLTDGPPGENLTMRLATETADFITQNKDSSFFAFLSFYAVHGPIQTTAQKWRKYQKKAESMGIARKGFEMERVLPYRLHQDNPIYGGIVESMDEAVGVVLSSLKKAGVWDNTIVVFTSDNGGVVSGDNYSTNLSPLRGGKGYQWEGGLRVPLIIALPERMSGGVLRKIETPVTGADLYPTLIELSGISQPEINMDGKSIVPALKGEIVKDRPLIWHYPHYGNQGGEPSSEIRMGDWKLIQYYEDGHAELYRLTEDMGEANDLSAKYPDIVQSMSMQLNSYLSDVGAKFPLPDQKFEAVKRAQWEENVRTTRLIELEHLRRAQLSPTYQPNVSWWGSENGLEK